MLKKKLGSENLISSVNGTAPVNVGFSHCESNATHSAFDGLTGSELVEFHSLQYAMFICIIVEILGGLFFVLNGWYIKQDRLHAQSIVAGEEKARKIANKG
jgi:hypothetical protein